MTHTISSTGVKFLTSSPCCWRRSRLSLATCSVVQQGQTNQWAALHSGGRPGWPSTWRVEAPCSLCWGTCVMSPIGMSTTMVRGRLWNRIPTPSLRWRR